MHDIQNKIVVYDIYLKLKVVSIFLYDSKL